MVKSKISVSNNSFPGTCFSLAFQQFDQEFWNVLAGCLLFTVVCSLHTLLLKLNVVMS